MADSKLARVATAARDLVQLRDRWLSPADASSVELEQRTLTDLYNKRPGWLENAHGELDRAVLNAYGWPHDLSDDDLLTRLLALNFERSAVDTDNLDASPING